MIRLLMTVVLTVVLCFQGYSQLGGLKGLKDKVKETTKENVKSNKEDVKSNVESAPQVKKGPKCEHSGTEIYDLGYSILGGNTDYHPQGANFVKIDPEKITVYLTNYDYYHECLPPIGTEGAPYIQRYNDRDFIRAIGYGPEMQDGQVSGETYQCAPRSNYYVVFPRIKEDFCALSYFVSATLSKDGRGIYAIPTDSKTKKITEEELKNRLAWDNCSFNGTESVDEGSKVKFISKQPGVSAYAWRAEGDVAIAGTTNQAEVEIKGTKAGSGKVCLKIKYKDNVVTDCEACKTVTVNAKDANAPTPVFTMTNCGNYSPKYVFTLADCKSDADYQWKAFSHNIHHPVEYDNYNFDDKNWVLLEGKGKCSVSDVNPQSRFEPFTISVTATYPSGTTKTYTQSIHPIVECPTHPSQGEYSKRNAGVVKVE